MSDVGLAADRFLGRIGDHEDRIALLERLLGEGNRYASRRNLLDNGLFRVTQRGTAFPGLGGINGYLIDRWRTICAGGQVITVAAPEVASPYWPQSKAQQVLVTTPAAMGAADRIIVYQTVEGNMSWKFWNQSGQRAPMVLSFWVYTNKAGLYTVEVRQLSGAVQRSISLSYTVTTLNEWVQYVLPIPADLSPASMERGSGAAVDVLWWLSAGSNYTSSPKVAGWTGLPTDATRATGQVNLAANLNNYWYMTRPQLEVGTSPTPFEEIPYDEELRRCHRYYRRLNNYEDSSGNAAMIGTGQAGSTTVGVFYVPLNVPMRIAPHTVGVSAQSHFDIWQGGSAYQTTGISVNADGRSPNGIRVEGSIATASLSTWGGVILRHRALTTSWLEASAEL